MSVLSVLALIVAISINAFAASKMQEIAEQKGSKERFWAWCFWVPLAGYAMVIALPDRSHFKHTGVAPGYRDTSENRRYRAIYDFDEDDYEFEEL